MQELSPILSGLICPYCDCPTQRVTGDVIYPEMIREEPRPEYLDKIFIQCIQNPDHYVGIRNSNGRSLGRVADKTLRAWKMRGHKAFDPLWQQKILPNQPAAYAWLAEKMNLHIDLTHFGMFTIEQCQEAIGYCHELMQTHKSD